MITEEENAIYFIEQFFENWGIVLKSTVEILKNGLNTNSINLVSSGQSMEEEITTNVFKTIRAE